MPISTCAKSAKILLRFIVVASGKIDRASDQSVVKFYYLGVTQNGREDGVFKLLASPFAVIKYNRSFLPPFLFKLRNWVAANVDHLCEEELPCDMECTCRLRSQRSFHPRARQRFQLRVNNEISHTRLRPGRLRSSVILLCCRDLVFVQRL
jgi:hypothetical protein